MSIDYYIIDPTGNITALVTTCVPESEYKIISSFIMKQNPKVEQVGFVDFSADVPKLNMAGGEFCGNATISTAALYCEQNKLLKKQLSVSVSGLDEFVTVDIQKENENFYGEVNIPKPKTAGFRRFEFDDITYNLFVADFPGITHIVLDYIISPDLAERLLKAYSKQNNASATGLIAYNKDDNSIIPIVYVPLCNTMFRENSCVSGSCAVASYLLTKDNNVDCRIKQPGGVLEVSTSRDDPKILLKGCAVIKKHIKEDFFYE